MAVLRKKSLGRQVEFITLDSTQATNQELFLDKTPTDETTVVLDLPCGTVQVLDFDYSVDGNRVFWGGLALETVLSLGDKIVITYN